MAVVKDNYAVANPYNANVNCNNAIVTPNNAGVNICNGIVGAYIGVFTKIFLDVLAKEHLFLKNNLYISPAGHFLTFS